MVMMWMSSEAASPVAHVGSYYVAEKLIQSQWDPKLLDSTGENLTSFRRPLLEDLCSFLFSHFGSSCGPLLLSDELP